MNPLTLRARLLATQLLGLAVSFSLAALFAPRVLLLEAEAADAATILLATLGLASAAFAVVLTVVLLGRVRPLLGALAIGAEPAPDPRPVLAIYRTPARLALATVGFVLVVSLVTLVPALRPRALDGSTELGLALLLSTMVGTTTLAVYVLARAQVARVLELAPPALAESAVRTLGVRVFGRLRKRYVVAAAAPVALVALLASLLADAHARAFEKEARVTDAIDVAHAVFEPLPSGGPDAVAGQREAMAAAEELGFHIRLTDGAETKVEEGTTAISVPLEGALAARIRIDPPRVSPSLPAYVVLLFAAVGLAALLGTWPAVFFEADVALATREIRRAGVADVMRGTILQHEARFANVHALMEAIDGLGGIFREFASAQQRAIEAREATERMRGLLLASMSHDLKAPLNAVLGFTELVRRNPLTREQHESLAIIEQRGRELLVLIDTILDSARVEAGELEVSPSPSHIDDVVMSSVLEARDLAVGTEVKIMGESEPGMPAVMIDSTRIVQALTAVVMTAARFSDKGIVPVRATFPPGDRMRIEVETSGEGLPLAEREKIFDAFKSAESARRQGGLGLGLQLARSIVEIHGGTIEVDSTGGGGMVFRVWLPIANDRASIRARASQPSVPMGI